MQVKQMKKKHLFHRIICALFACIFLLSMTALTVGAADDPAAQDDPAVTGDPVTGEDPDQGDDPDTGEDPDTGNPADTPTEAPADDPAQGELDPPEPTEADDEPTEAPTEPVPEYTKPEHLDELDEVTDGEVAAATAVPVPKAEVSDASLFSGIVMWLCVAVGIAVVVGVMVSKRTRRRG